MLSRPKQHVSYTQPDISYHSEVQEATEVPRDALILNKIIQEIKSEFATKPLFGDLSLELQRYEEVRKAKSQIRHDQLLLPYQRHKHNISDAKGTVPPHIPRPWSVQLLLNPSGNTSRRDIENKDTDLEESNHYDQRCHFSKGSEHREFDTEICRDIDDCMYRNEDQKEINRCPSNSGYAGGESESEYVDSEEIVTQYFHGSSKNPSRQNYLQTSLVPTTDLMDDNIEKAQARLSIQHDRLVSQGMNVPPTGRNVGNGRQTEDLNIKHNNYNIGKAEYNGRRSELNAGHHSLSRDPHVSTILENSQDPYRHVMSRNETTNRSTINIDFHQRSNAEERREKTVYQVPNVQNPWMEILKSSGQFRDPRVLDAYRNMGGV